ncbi:zinc ribbon domain-containing protein [Actinomyces sp.]|uniref:zinc ribbon domain-containing protein n=1 Tax=Actinomyces sp. TaxID=29317 RepID=UPI0026DC3F6E|nr:zinc ribbon domain-containing protein [Actinomyces sp.]MDO4901283.1 zinc ribbon domain-containing protein [Actinomyces sp.]
MTNSPLPDQQSPYANNGGRPRNYDVPTWRKAAYYGGAVLQGVGLLMFFSVFVVGFTAFSGFGASSNFPADMGQNVGRMFRSFPLSLVGFILIGIGQWIRRVGKEGLAGSGVVLSPQGEARDAEPWKRSEGAQDQMRLEEMPTLQTALSGSSKPAGSPAEVVRLRCRSCGYLETEDATFCSQCGQQI